MLNIDNVIGDLKIDNISDKLLKCCKVRALISMTVGDGS